MLETHAACVYWEVIYESRRQAKTTSTSHTRSKTTGGNLLSSYSHLLLLLLPSTHTVCDCIYFLQVYTYIYIYIAVELSVFLSIYSCRFLIRYGRIPTYTYIFFYFSSRSLVAIVYVLLSISRKDRTRLWNAAVIYYISIRESLSPRVREWCIYNTLFKDVSRSRVKTYTTCEPISFFNRRKRHSSVSRLWRFTRLLLNESSRIAVVACFSRSRFWGIHIPGKMCVFCIPITSFHWHIKNFNCSHQRAENSNIFNFPLSSTASRLLIEIRILY